MFTLKPKKLELDLLRLIPNFLCSKMKGDNGKIAILGGSFEYTGAPYYVGISSLRAGADLCHIFCSESAGTSIKSYSPELIVHPLVPEEEEGIENKSNLSLKIARWMESMHGVVIGPGLGRPAFMGTFLAEVMRQKVENLLCIVDADGLWALNESKPFFDLILMAKDLILTPNYREFDKLWIRVMKEKTRMNKEEITKRMEGLSREGVFELELSDPLGQDCVELARTLGNKILVLKGEIDIITDGKRVYAVAEEGCKKRCGGQGDILAENEGNEGVLSGCVLACLILRKAARKAFEKKFIGLTAPDIIEEIIPAFLEYRKEKAKF